MFMANEGASVPKYFIFKSFLEKEIQNEYEGIGVGKRGE